MSAGLSGNIIQRPNRIATELSTVDNHVEGKLAPPRDAYQLAKLLDPTIGTLEEWIASLEGAVGPVGPAARCMGVFASVTELLEAWPDGPPGQNFWAFALDNTDPVVVWVYHFAEGGGWAAESFDLPIYPLATDPELAGNSDAFAPSQKAVKAYVDAETQRAQQAEAGLAPLSHTHDDRYYTETEVDSLLSGKVPTSRTVNGKALSANITLTPSDVGAQPAGSYAPAAHTHDDRYYTETEIDSLLSNKVPTSRTVNGKSLSANITLGPSDVGAQPAGSYATLDEIGKVPAAQLPSYVDDVLEYDDLAHFPASGTAGIIYVAKDSALIYRWSGSGYVVISPSPGSTDSVPEGSVNQYFTAARAAAAAPVQSVNSKSGAVVLSAADVGAATTAQGSKADTALQPAAVGVTIQAHSTNLDDWSAKTAYAGTITVSSSKTLNVTASVTLTGTDGATLNIGGGGTLGSLAFQSNSLSGTNTGDVTIGTANGLTLSGQVLSLATASATVTGALSASDWGVFNAKVPSSRTVNGKALSSDITLSAADVGADAAGAAAAVQTDLDIAKALTYSHLHTGVVSGGALSVNADTTKFNISDGVGYVVDYWTTPGSPVVTKVVWSGKTAQSSPYLTSEISTTVMIDATGALVFQPDPATRANYSQYIVLGKLLHPNRTTITGVSQYQHSVSGSIGNGMDLMHFMGTLASGILFVPHNNDLLLTRSAGSLLRIGGNYVTSKETPNITPIAAQSTATFSYRYRNGSGGFTIEASGTSFRPNVYDDGTGTLHSVGNNYANHRVYIFSSGNAYVVPGQTTYNSLADAVAAIPTETFAVDPQLADANLRTIITCRGSVTSLQSSNYVRFTQGGLLGVLGGAAGGSSSTSIPGGSSYDLQYNNGGALGGAAITGLVKAQGAVGPPVVAVADTDYMTPSTSIALSIALS